MPFDRSNAIQQQNTSNKYTGNQSRHNAQCRMYRAAVQNPGQDVRQAASSGGELRASSAYVRFAAF